ncbi:unnamed protein product [Dovyalis caffra]|uniref:Bifunctional inhibitor/plant lipid transfer protein/seed storage helical domain-containing protein n=1 Tax=Dovyalis caffra TaxID=77055 RepID=A0AAV1S1S6_9ROSI|nr:unnamed protein product [Dovyalis caffra]
MDHLEIDSASPFYKFLDKLLALMHNSCTQREKKEYIAVTRLLKMKKLSFFMIMVVVVMLFAESQVSQAVTCNPRQLSPCLGAITSSAPPSATCCSKLKEQKPCLCGYLKDPSLKQFVSSPGARKVASACGVLYPTC